MPTIPIRFCQTYSILNAVVFYLHLSTKPQSHIRSTSRHRGFLKWQTNAEHTQNQFMNLFFFDNSIEKEYIE